MDKIGVYILKCGSGRFYIGSTDNIERRFEEHSKGYVKATRNVLPVELVVFQPCPTLLGARRMERWLKSLKSRRIVEQIVRDKCIKRV